MAPPGVDGRYVPSLVAAPQDHAVPSSPVPDRNTHRRAVVHLLVPADLSDRLYHQLRDWFADDPQVMVAVERRRGDDRRRGDLGGPDGFERRSRDRRHLIAESTAAIEGLELPWLARRHAPRLRLVLSPVPVHPDGWDRSARDFVARARAGEPAALDELRLHHYARVRTAVERAVGGRRAADTTDEVFRVAFDRLMMPSAQSPAGFTQWLGAVTAEVTHHHGRTR